MLLGQIELDTYLLSLRDMFLKSLLKSIAEFVPGQQGEQSVGSQSIQNFEGVCRTRPSARGAIFLPHAAEESQTNVLCNIARTNGIGLRKHGGTISAIRCQPARNFAGKKAHSSSQLP